MGERIISELRGVPCIYIEEVAPNRKSLITSRSFGRPVETFNEMQDAVASYASREVDKMRRQGLTTYNLIVFIETNPFKKQDRQYRASQAVQLPIAAGDTSRLVAAAKNGPIVSGQRDTDTKRRV